MKDHDLNKRALEIGKIIIDRFSKLKKEFPEIGDVRGVGAMTAMEFVKNGDPMQPDSEICDALIKGCA